MTDSTLHVEDGDGASSELTVFRAPRADAKAPVLVCLPAMGVAASYYAPLAEALRGQGCHAVTADLRGIGSSSVRASRRADFGYHEVVELDLPAIVAAVRGALPASPIYLLGHSLGGQLACLFAATRPEAVAGLVLIASCSVYHRGWRFPGNLVLLCFQQLARIAALAIGHFPGGRVGFGGREARRLMGDWARQGLTGRYRVAGSKRDFEALLARLELPILAISFTDDPYCTRAAVDYLLAKMPAADATHRHRSPSELGAAKLGHFSWVKQAELLLPSIHEWLPRAQVTA